MKQYVQTYFIGRKSSLLNRNVPKGAKVLLNGLLLQPGFDYVKQKRNVKFTVPLEKGDIIEILEMA